jgi:hypothetical protein
LLTGCDLGSRDDEASHGPPLHVLATYPVDGQGVAATADAGLCDADGGAYGCAIPTNVTAVQLRFDRFLYPLALESGFRLYAGDPDQNSVPFSAGYDPIERVVSFTLQSPLQPEELYTGEVILSPQFGSGFWAFDRAPLEAGSVPLKFVFKTGSGPAPTPPPTTPPVPTQADSCDTLAGPSSTVFSHCAKSNCHLDIAPPMGLALTDPWHVKHTAISQVAHEADTGEKVGSPLPLSPRFGTGMPIINPGFPETSYLLYKVLRRPENYGGCSPSEYGDLPLPNGTCTYASPQELDALHEWFSRGLGMPRDQSEESTNFLSRDQLDRLELWIKNDAPCNTQ